MWIFGDKCVRCGNRLTKKTLDGIPTCDTCRLALQAEREEKRICPVDGSPMRKGAIQNVIIDRCPACKGIWLDGGELDLVEQMVKDENRGQFSNGFITGMIIG